MHDPILLTITEWFNWILAVVVLTFWRRVTLPQRLIILLIVMIAGSDLLELILTKSGKHNLWVSHFSTLIEFLLMSGVFFLWNKNGKKKSAIVLLAIAFIMLWIVSKLTFEPFDRYDSYTTGIARALEIIYAVSLLFDVLKDPNLVIKNDARVWVSSANIVYSTGCLLIFTLFNTLLKYSVELFKVLWPLNWVLLIISSSLYFKGILCRVPQEGCKIKNPASAGIINQSHTTHNE
jgi:hypothetical protein